MPGAASSENGTDVGSRRAAVVAFVDIVGSSILLAEDEAGTHARWMRLLREVIRPQTGRFRGRIVKSTGDGVLAEFPTGRDGIEWGREVQLASQRLAMAEPALSSAILLRIALNVGNVIVTDEDIYGVSVHTAARLQEHAEPGGIVLTEAVREQAGDAVGRDVRDLGMVHLKGFAQPVRVYALPPELRIRPALARPRPAHLPSIAVMPLENLGGDPTDEYFAAGIVEDIIVSLGGLHELMVISRASTVTFRQHPADVREVGQRLGVHYVMTGSVRRSPRTLRVSAQLCDAESGANLWGDTTESPTEKLFEIQDLIVQRIVSGIAPNIRAEELRRALRKRPESFTAYDYTLRALDVINSLNAATFSRARAHLEAAMQEDPGFALPVAWMARWHSLRIGQGWSKDRRRDASRAMALAGRAIELDRHNALALATYAHVRSYLFHDYDAALVYFDRAISACPNSALARVLSSLTLSYVGRGEEALRQGEQALRLSPVDQLLFFYYVALAVAHLSLANYEEAIRWGRMCTSENPKFTANLRILIAALVGAGRDQEARSTAACLLRQTPGFSLREYKQTLQPFRDDAIRERYLEQLARAGLPA